MPGFTDPRFQEAELLTRAVDNVFRKLIRFLVGRMSLVRLQEMIRYIYVEETEKKLRREDPGRNVPLTKLALNTGLDTRTLVQVRKRLDLGEQQYQQQFLAELTPESAVVEAWAERVRTAADGRDQSVMAYGAEDAPFERLVRSTIATRGITTRSLIERLVATNSVEQDRQNRRLKLLVESYSPYLSNDEPSMLNAAFSAISNLISTIERNVAAGREDKLFQRQAWTFRLDPASLAGFRSDLRAMLEEYEAAAKRRIEPWESARYDPGHVTAGVGLYYFEDL